MAEGGVKIETNKDGQFVRAASKFRDRVTADGSSGFKAEPGRYHLYVSYGCPWAHRTLIFRALKGLEKVISLSVTNYILGEKGWSFHENPGVIPDPVKNAEYLRELYLLADPEFTGRVTVPVLWDLKKNTIVNNESSEIIRMFNSEFNEFAEHPELDFYPEELRGEIDAVNEWVYNDINSGVYKTGFASTQEAYEQNCRQLFKSLDRAEEILSKTRYLTGSRLTEADLRLFPTLLRFDPCYHGHFKCNLYQIGDKPHLLGLLREIYQLPGVKETVDMLHIKNGYHMSMTHINPTRIVPLYNGPDLSIPHGREHLPSQ